MSYKTKADLATEKAITLGGKADNGTPNPSKIEGYYLGFRITPDKGFGEGKLHIFQTGEGNVGVWGKTHLNQLLTSELVGQMVLVTFTGMSKPQKKGRRPGYRYQIQHDEDNRIDTSSIDLAEESSSDDYSDEYIEESSLDAEEAIQDEIQAAPAKAPARALTAPDKASQAKVQALLNGGSRKSA